MIAVAALLVPDVPWVARLLVASALVAPVPTGVAVVGMAFVARRRERPPSLGREAGILLEVVAALRSGATLRMALAGMSPSVSRRVAVGAATSEVAACVEEQLGERGALAGAAVRLLDRTGGPAVPVMEELATQAAEQERLRREVRAAVAAPVLQGVIVGGAPLAVLVHLVVTGSLMETMAASSAHAVTVVAGITMTLVGCAWVLSIIRRARP